MIKKIEIKNFKSIPQLELELGRINIFIGANGSGKSNILEGITMGAAALAGKLEPEFLSTRIRMTSADLMTSAFELPKKNQVIDFQFTDDQLTSLKFKIEYKEDNWSIDMLSVNDLPNSESIERKRNEILAHLKKEYLDLSKTTDDNTSKDNLLLWKEVLQQMDRLKHSDINAMLTKWVKKNSIDKFLIFAPENHFLRNFKEESQIRPIGIRGEGLFSHIMELHKKKPALLTAISEHLRVLDWFDGFEIPNDLMFTERRIRIKDNYLEDGLVYFDQQSSNEGFLYLLFYYTLFISNATPKFFAIDNIDNAMNPKLGRRLIKTLVQLAKEHDKQAIFTTHNPAILDGLNLFDDEQRLFMIYRDGDGFTQLNRVFKKVGANMPLSEMFLRGYLGGLPNNF
jgi:AAA15 family ATPase/GTPase